MRPSRRLTAAATAASLALAGATSVAPAAQAQSATQAQPALTVGVAPTATAAPNTSQIAFTYLVSKGWSKAQAAGFLGNFMVETGSPINPTAGTTYHGIAQWGGGRWTALVNWANAQGRSPWALLTQLDYLTHELSHSEYVAAGRIRATTTPEAAAEAVLRYYERGSTATLSKRKYQARVAYNTWAPTRNTDSSYRTLWYGVVAPSVVTARLLLRYWGHPTWVHSGYDNSAIWAEKAFERSGRLPIDGAVHDRDWTVLTPADLHYGHQGDAVRALQHEMNAEVTGLPKIAVNGVFDNATRERVRAVQSLNGLTVTGKAEEALWRILVD